MTNWTQNEWVVTGPPAALDAFEALALTPGRSPVRAGLFRRALVGAAPCLDIPRLVPEPAGLDAPARQTWRADHWGTDREADPQDYVRTPERADLTFATAWAHPIGAMEALAPLLPEDVTIRGTYMESGNSLAGRFTLVRGHLDNAEVELVEGFEMILSGPWVEEE